MIRKQLTSALPAFCLTAAMLSLTACGGGATQASADKHASPTSAAWTLNAPEDTVAFEQVRQRDLTITDNIESRLAGNGGLSPRSIDIDTSHGHVVLRGYASNTAAREQATSLAKSVAGVVSVENLLHVRA